MFLFLKLLVSIFIMKKDIYKTIIKQKNYFNLNGITK